MKTLFGKPETSWAAAALVACALLLGALFVPLWRMELVAPQYPTGLVMKAYGYKFADDSGTYYDDIREINGLNHYIGMKPIEEVTEMQMFVPGVLALMAATVLVSFVAWKRRWLQALITIGFWVLPLFFVADLQWWLYHYGHTMDEEAALNTGAFTPKVFGTTKVWNFHSETGFELGFYLMVAAALVITIVPIGSRWLAARTSRAGQRRERAEARTRAARPGPAIVAKVLVIGLLVGAGALPLGGALAQDAGGGGGELTLQQRIDRAAPEDIIVVDGGVFRESVRIDKPISLIGRNWPVIDGGGQGDVVTISADDAVISGFEIRGSSEAISREPAAVKIDDADRVKVEGNRIRESHFGIHVTDSKDSAFNDNVIDIGARTPVERRGHAVYLWKVDTSTVHGNTIRNAADGIHLEFSERNGIGQNEVTKSRYALHFMYADGNRIIGNEFHDNLAGAVLMFSNELILKDNELSGNRRGASGTGILIKDGDNLFVEGNRLLRNKFGMTVDGAPQSAGATAIFHRNLFALNDVGVGLMSNAPITFVENAMIENTVQVRALSGELLNRALSGHGDGVETGATPAGAAAELPKGAVWSSDGRGNYWSDYRGYDADGDGVGDQPYLPRPPFAGRLGNEDTLRLFQFTLAQQAIDMAADMFPVYRYNAVIEDGQPLMEPPSGLTLAHGSRVNVRLLGTSVALSALAALAVSVLSGANLRRALAQPWRRAGGQAPA